MSDRTFKLTHSQTIASLSLSYESYEHLATGARHIHLQAPDRNNVFLVAFPTMPQDSTGVAHILEHTALCGSRRYPVRDPFFMMLRRSLNTFMNAFTSSDATAYPFATQNDKDFDNLLGVYLDAVFFPLLDELDFAQEGHRIELEEGADGAARLVYKGVVFNEMKGAMSAPMAQLWQHLQSNLFPTTTYHWNSGGDPRAIPNLSHAALREFHRAHYHPSHAIFMTYGDRPAADHQARFEALALSKFERAPHRWSVPDERRYTSPKAVRVSYAAEAGAAEGNTHIVWGWLLGHTIDVDASLDAHLLAGALLDNSSSPLRHYLESSGLASAPSELCGLEDSTRELVMCCGVEDAKTNAETALERGVLGVLERVASDGVPQDVIAGLIDRMEMSQRDIGGNHYPYGLQLMNRLLRPALHGANPCDFLDIDPALVRLRDRAGADTHVPNLIRRHLLDNPHRVRVTMAPDKALADRQRAEEEANLRRLLANADCERLNAIRARARALKERQSRADDSNVLPRLTLADVPADIPVVIGADRRFGGIQGRCYARGTNGIVYQQVVVPLPAFPPEQLMWLPYFVDYLTDVGFGPHDYLQAERDRAAIGAFNAQVSLRAAIFDAGWLRGYLAIGGKALLRKHGLLFDRLHAMYAQARFDEHARLRELIAQSRAEMEATITDRGHMLAMHAAAARLSPAGWLDDQWDGPSAIAALKSLDDAADSGGVEDFAARLAGIAALLRNAEPRLLLVAEEAELRELEASLERVWESAQAYATPPHRLEVPPVAERADTAYTTNTRVNFCACAYRTVPEQHADAPVLMVLGRYLQNGFLHQAIRERGGAYGSGAGYSADGAIFQYYSYRDPRFTGTFDDFAASLGWLIKTRDARQLEEAILGVIRALDQPKSPAGEAIAAYYNELHGRDVDFRRHLRRAVLAVGYDDLLRVAGQYLIGATPARAVVTSADEAAEAERAGFRVAEL